MKEIGLFCGTFNPIHLGHLLIAECARDQFALTEVLFVTSPTPPHRSTGLLAGEERHRLVQAAIKDNQHFQASRLELDKPGTSYTVDTVKQVLEAQTEPSRVNLIIGGDNLPFLKDWHRSEELLSLCRLIVVPRLRYLSEAQADAQLGQNNHAAVSQVVKTIAQTQPDHIDHSLSAGHLGEFHLGPHEFKIVDFPGIAISSSTIPKRIANHKTVLYMVPPAVDKIIRDSGHYKDPA